MYPKRCTWSPTAANAGIAKRHGKQLTWTGTRRLVWNDRSRRVIRSGACVDGRSSRLIRAEAEQWRLKATDTEDGKARAVRIAAALDARSKKSETGSTMQIGEAAQKEAQGPSGTTRHESRLLNCANGTVDLRTGTLKAHRPEDYITRVVPINFDPKATAPEFITTLARITCEYGESSKPLCAFLQRWFGDCATGEVRNRSSPRCTGLGITGKARYWT
ncbi:hypothetical protein [Xylella fastidiosa]|uniref:hypothetical protein n=1 Tax=Xylella fastidiosa TaxID=2371 RepID=UPI003984A988